MIQAIFGVFQGPAFDASVTMLIPDSERDRANGIRQLTGPMSGIVAPALSGFIYAAVGISGAIIIDLVTFLVAVAVVLNVHIPRPEETEEGRAMAGSFWKEAIGGLKYLWNRRPLFMLVVHVSMLNFLISGAGVLMTPYLLARTGSETTLGVLLSVMNIGALAGGLVMTVWKGTRPRIHTFMIGVIVATFFIALFGTVQTPLTLGLLLVLLMFPIPMVNAVMMSIMQSKVAPDVQGRVFAVMGQMAMLATPIAYLLVGPLADEVFTPMVGTPAWDTIGSVVGQGAGSGMGFIFVMGGLSALVLTIVVYAVPSMRHLEANLPDFKPEVQPEPDDISDVSVEALPA